MAGLREKQKAAREKRILAAAVTRFRADGYHSVRIEDLAEEAEVSVGTVYNYYGTKGDILIATVALEVEEVLASGAAIVADPPADPEAALCGLVLGYYDHSLEYLSKEMWRSALALSIEAPRTPNGARYSDLDARLSSQVAALIARLVERGDLRADLNPEVTGRIVFDVLNQEFVGFVRDDTMSLTALRSRVAGQIETLTRMMRRQEAT